VTALPMTEREQREHAEHVANARLAYRLLAAIPNRDEDLAVAIARVDEWVGANEGRWVKP
jgi:hypothetical protein